MGFEDTFIKDKDKTLVVNFLYEVGCPQDRELFFCAEGTHMGEDMVAAVDIEANGGFIEEEELWFMEQGANDFHAPPLSAGEESGFCLAVFYEVRLFQQVEATLGGVFFGHAMERGVIEQILLSRQVEVEGDMLKDDS